MSANPRLSFVRRWKFWAILGLGLAGGFMMFCLPELRLKTANPEGWKIIWGSSPLGTCTRCILFSLLEGAGVGLVAGVVFFAFGGRQVTSRWRK